jgi:hypothetical protein
LNTGALAGCSVESRGGVDPQNAWPGAIAEFGERVISDFLAVMLFGDQELTFEFRHSRFRDQRCPGKIETHFCRQVYPRMTPPLPSPPAGRGRGQGERLSTPKLGVRHLHSFLLEQHHKLLALQHNRLLRPQHPSPSPTATDADRMRQPWPRTPVHYLPGPYTPRERGDRARSAWWVRGAPLSSKLRSRCWGNGRWFSVYE